jgi:hypothetical protein
MRRAHGRSAVSRRTRRRPDAPTPRRPDAPTPRRPGVRVPWAASALRADSPGHLPCRTEPAQQVSQPRPEPPVVARTSTGTPHGRALVRLFAGAPRTVRHTGEFIDGRELLRTQTRRCAALVSPDTRSDEARACLGGLRVLRHLLLPARRRARRESMGRTSLNGCAGGSHLGDSRPVLRVTRAGPRRPQASAGRCGSKRAIGWRVAPSTARSARISPTTGTNLKP